MSVRRRELERVLLRAERCVHLVERCRPLNLLEEHARLVGAWRRGEPLAPSHRYGRPPDLSELRAALESVAEHASELGPWGVLYAERARELALEAELAAHVGQPGFANAAARRYGASDDEDARRAEGWARAWAGAHRPDEVEPRIVSDDERDGQSLVSLMRREVGEHRLPFRVVLRRDLLSAAATGESVILVRAGATHTPSVAQRIVLHEVSGHAWPRARAERAAHGLFAVGTRGGADDEEGRALLLERRGGFLGSERKAELGRRHLACLGLRGGASFVDTVRMLLGYASPLEDALAVAARVHRGGGLGREIVYLPALARVERAIGADPDVERWLERGRIGVGAVAMLRELGPPPDLMRERAA